MRPKQRSLLIVFIILLIGGAIFAAALIGRGSSESIPQSVPQSTSEEPSVATDSFEKLSPDLRLRLSQRSAETNPLNILIQTNAALTPAERSQLEAAGANVRTVAGDIVTATVPLNQVLSLAELEFVRSIEASTPLYPESTP